MSMSEQPADFRTDVERLLNGTLDAHGVRRLEAALLDNPTLQQQFLDYCQLHTDLGLSIASDRALEFAFEGIGRPAADAASPSSRMKQVARFLTRPTPTSISVAALVIGVMITAMAFIAAPFYRAITRVPEAELPPDDLHRIVAQLTQVHQPVWAPDKLAPSRGAYLHAGRRLELVSGFAEVTFRRGATVTIEGPATWVVADEGLLKLDVGQMVAQVTPQGVGFAVETRTARITDLSTQFSVVAEPSRETTAHVFEGRVAVVSLASKTEKVRILTAGQGARVTAGGVIEEFHEAPALVHNIALSDVRGPLRAFTSYRYLGDESDPRKATQGPGYPDDAREKLVDGRIGSRSHKDGAWVGWSDAPTGDTGNPQPAIVLDAGEIVALDKLHIAYLVQHHLAIHAPDRVMVSLSDDGESFAELLTASEFRDDLPPDTPGQGTPGIAHVGLQGARARYVRLDFYNDQQWTFLSEVFLTVAQPSTNSGSRSPTPPKQIESQ